MGYTAGDFFKAIYKRCTKGQVEFRSLPSLRRRFVSLSNLQTLSPFSKTDNHFFGVGTRDGSGGGKNNLVENPALWVDIDFKKTAREEFERKLADFPLKPSIIVETGGGYHVYWLLKEPCPKEDIPKIENYLSRLASHFGGDPGAMDASRILRIPGTLNLKYTPPWEVVIKSLNASLEYNLSDFDFLPDSEKPYSISGRSVEKTETLQKVMECRFLKHCDEERATLPEPHWYAMVLILSRLSGGRTMVHSLSRGYPKYDPKETDEKILHAIDGSGPATCDYIKSLWDCKNDCGIRSPISLMYQTTNDKHFDNEAPVNCQDKSGHHFNLIWAKDIVSIQEPQREWIWEGILPAGGLSLVVAKPKVGKTTLALQLAVAVSRGDIFLGRKTRQATVVYLALEEHRDEVQKNLSKLGVTDEPLYIHFGPAPAEAMREVEPLIKETGAKFLVIDILQKFCRVKDLNDYAQVTRTLEPLMASGRKLDCQISLTHHAGKADREDGDDILGSTGLLGGVDTSIHIKKRNKESRIFSTIQRYGVDVLQTVIALKDGCLVMEGSREEVEIEETVPFILVTLEEGPLTEKDIWARVEKDHSRVSSALRKLVEQKAVTRTGTGKRGNPFVYEKDSLLLSSHIYEEGKREMKVEPNPLESGDNISLDHFHKNQPLQERIKREIPGEKQGEEDSSKGGLYEAMDDGQLTY